MLCNVVRSKVVELRLPQLLHSSPLLLQILSHVSHALSGDTVPKTVDPLQGLLEDQLQRLLQEEALQDQT